MQTREENVIFKALWDGFLIRAEGQVSNKRQLCQAAAISNRNSRLSLSLFSSTVVGSLGDFLRSPMQQISCVFWHACSRMPGICRPFHSQAPGPFITRLFNQLAVTKPRPSTSANAHHITPTINMAALLPVLTCWISQYPPFLLLLLWISAWASNCVYSPQFSTVMKAYKLQRKLANSPNQSAVTQFKRCFVWGQFPAGWPGSACMQW